MSRAVALLLGILLSSATAFSQAWTPLKGHGSAGVTYEFIEFRGHYDSAGNRYPIYGSRTQSATLEFEYGLSDRLALDVRLPYVASRYTDRTPPNAPDDLRQLLADAVQQAKPARKPRFLDDGTYNATFQDFRVGARYKLLDRSFVLTPFVSFTIPSHHYDSIGESSPGRDLKEFQTGVNVGRNLGPIAPRIYVQGQYAYSAVQRFLNLSTNHSDAQLAVSYLIRNNLSARAVGSWGQVHGGLPFEEALLTAEGNLQHEKLLKATYWHLGGGFTYAVNPSLDVHATFIGFLTGKDTHYGKGIALGTSWNFSRL